MNFASNFLDCRMPWNNFTRKVVVIGEHQLLQHQAILKETPKLRICRLASGTRDDRSNYSV